MSLLESLVVGGYVYTTGVFLFLYRLLTNHYATRLKRLEQAHEKAHGTPLDESEDAEDTD